MIQKGTATFCPMLANKRVSFFGEVTTALAVAQARNASELTEGDYDELPVHLARKADGTTMHFDALENLAF